MSARIVSNALAAMPRIKLPLLTVLRLNSAAKVQKRGVTWKPGMKRPARRKDKPGTTKLSRRLATGSR